MCADYVAAGLPPDRFWQITPRLFHTEMTGAIARRKEERVMTWFGAMLPHLKKPIPLDQFIGGEKKATDITAWKAAWDKVDRALAANKNRRVG